MLNIEPAFPRGSGGDHGVGRGSFSGQGRTKRTKKTTAAHNYGATSVLEPKVHRLRPKERNKILKTENEMDEADTQQALTAAYLSIDTISPGMLVMGCIKYIHAADVELVLPGRIKANLPMTNISNEYTERLMRMTSAHSTDCPTLKDMYRRGDLIYVKVLEVNKTMGRIVTVSAKPNDLHSDFAPAQLVPGLVLAATIVAKEDHGYLMDVGIRNVRAFLPDANLGENENDLGRNLVCSVEQVSQLTTSATIVLKAFNPNAPWVLNVEEATLETVVPGCRLTFTVGEPVEFGLRGMIFDDTVPAYVNELMLTTTTSTPKKYTMFKKLPATLLYVMPHTNQVFVSLRPYTNNRIEVDVPNGPGTTIEKACVKYVNGAGVWLQFGSKHRALLPRGVLLRKASELGNVDASVVMGNYQIGTTHKVSVMHYDPLMDVYLVTNDPTLVDADIRTGYDIIIGKTYNCRVAKKEADKIYVSVGHAKGALQWELYDRRTPLTVNEHVLVRAVSLVEGTSFVRFTNHPSLLDKNAKILQDWDQLDATKKNQRFHGIVSHIHNNKFIVKFFNGMVGIVLKHYVQNDPAKLTRLTVGSVEEFVVVRFDKTAKKILLVLPYDDDQINPIVVDAKIICIHATGVEVQTDDGKTGTIPSESFSEFGEHNSLYMRLLQEGKTIPVIKTNSGTYSFRLIEYFKTHPMQIQSVTKGTLLKGSCITVNGVLYATPLLSNYQEQIVVEGSGRSGSVPNGSTIMMRVKNVRHTGPNVFQLEVNTLLKQVCENGINSVYEFVDTYMKDVDDLIQRYREKGFAFANYTIGQQVECVVESVVPYSEKLAIEVHAIDKESNHAAKGIGSTVAQHQPASSYKPGTKLPGRVVWVDVERMLVHVCLDQSLFKRIALDENNESQATIPKTPQECWVLFANNYIQVCCLRSGPVQLLLVPVKHHYNEFESCENVDNTANVKLIKPLGSMILAMREQMFIKFRSLNASKNKRRSVPFVSSKDGEPASEETNGVNENVLPIKKKKKKTNELSSLKDEETVSTVKLPKKKNLKRKLVDKELENGKDGEPAQEETNGVNGKMLPIKKKKKKTNELSSLKDEETMASVKLPKKVKKAKNAETLQQSMEDEDEKAQKSTKQSIPFIGNKKKAKKSTLKNKTDPPFLIDQLDGANDFFLPQLDGANDRWVGTAGKQTGAKKRKNTPVAQGLPGASNFWDSTPVYKRSVANSSDDESDNSDEGETVPKKRATPKERFEAMKQEEERLRKIEEELANPSVDPHTPDQFDRLVLAQPNNSMLWIRYMAFHMESAELEKARAVGRKALKAIHFREETDRLNVWIALLNLEIRYDTVDSFKEVLQEAIQYNDAFKVYTRVIDILIDCQKHTEVQELLELLLKKFRKENDMWYLVADAWYRIGQGSKVKPLLSQALKSLPNRDHIPLIVKFAFLHNRNENRDEAHLLFEQILTSYPKRTDIWSQYIDMLVKDNLIGNARQILERAIMQRLPLKNMKTLYTKYVNFEEKHGDRDSVRRVKQLAADYVQAQLNNAGVKS